MKLTKEQLQAINPKNSVWVNASAGSGKTKTLTDRILRLLMEGINPSTLLCITYTRVATAEMINRLMAILAKWATLEQELLIKELTEIKGEYPTLDDINLAHKLFHKVLDAEGGLKILTIHSFCQSILGRFPIEAGINPNITVVDEKEQEEWMKQASDSILLKHHESPEIKDYLTTITNCNISFSSFEEIINNLLKDKDIRKIKKTNINETAKIFNADLNIDFTTFWQEHLKQIPNSDKFNKLEPVLTTSGANKGGINKNSELKVNAIKNFLSFNKVQRAIHYNDWINAINRNTKPFTEELELEKIRVNEALKNYAPVKYAHLSNALTNIAYEISQEYNNIKKYENALDYNDLLEKTDALLNSNKHIWVKYKLDANIEHILLDEAQDTSEIQWSIIKSLLDEKLSGDGINKTDNKTIFVVGDEKQSIYSFQGASPKSFIYESKNLAEKFKTIGKKLELVNLNTSFRSLKNILYFVDTVFENDEFKQGMGINKIQHNSFRTTYASEPEGYVSVEPLISYADTENIAEEASKYAGTIIKDAINRGYNAGDITILTRKRNPSVKNFMRYLIQFCTNNNINVAGADRLTLKNHIAIMDLISLGKVLIQSADDLSLAEVLKSPIFNVSEEELYNIASNRNIGETIYNKLEPDLKNKLNYYKKLATTNTPFDFYTHILYTEGLIKNFVKRLSYEVLLPLEGFLNSILDFEYNDIPTLINFINWFDSAKIEQKREFSKSENKISHMTIHGAKGLQNKIVIVLDFNHRKNRQNYFIHNGIIIQNNKELNNELMLSLKENREDEEKEEQNRQLYVALTRAENELYFIPIRETSNANPLWYKPNKEKTNSILEEAIGSKLNKEIAKEVIKKDGKTIIYNKYKVGSKLIINKNTVLEDTIKIPTWAKTPAEAEKLPSTPLNPSKLNNKFAPIFSPLENSELSTAEDGLIVHQLLEWLPNQSIDVINSIKDKIKDNIWQTIKNVLNNKEIEFLFDKNGLTEVSVTGVVDEIVVSGRIDRLIIKENEVIIVDYKNAIYKNETSIEPYKEQLLAYKRIIKEIYKNKKIRCGILYTKNAKWVEL